MRRNAVAGKADGKMMRRAWSLYGLLVLASVVYGACLFTGLDQWGRGDWDQFSFRYETPRRALLHYRQLPLWNPYVGGGNVLLAHPHCPAFSPWYLPTLLLGAPLGLRFSVVLFVALGSTGMAALLRRWEVSPAGCFLGGVLLMMSAHFALHVTEGHLEWCVLGLMPWVVLCLVRAVAGGWRSAGGRPQPQGSGGSPTNATMLRMVPRRCPSTLGTPDWRFTILGALLFASGLLYGSIYVVAVFVPVLVLWAVLESIRTYCWRLAASCAAVIGLAFLLSAVVLFPRIEFLRANPRSTRQDEQVSPAAFARMLLDPRQADLFRQTRDVRNPPDAELDRLLPARSSSAGKRYDTLKWHRLEVVLTTTSDWSDVRFQNFPYRLFVGGLGAEEKTPAELNRLPQTTEWLAITPSETEQAKQTKRATLYVRVPDQGDLQLLVKRGNLGTTKLTITRGDEVLLDVIHSMMEPGDLENRRTFTISRYKILGQRDPDEPSPAEPWYSVEATLRTTAAWCDVQVVNSPYVFRIHRWKNRGQREIQPSMSGLATGSPVPGKAEGQLEATLYFQRPEEENLRIALLQGPEGTSTLTLKTPQGDAIAADRSQTTAKSGEKTFEYVLSQKTLDEQLPAEPMPLRWRLDQWGMWRDWQEYGCYVTWLGLAAALLGLIVSFRRQWPLLVTGLAAGLVVLGAALPLNLWVLWKQLPLYGSLQVPSRFLVAVVFAVAVCGGYGADRLGTWAERIGGRWVRRLLVAGIGLAVYAELLALGWNLFSDVFVCQPREVPHNEQFAQRHADDDAIRHPSMYSALYPYLLSNSGVLREYENVAVKPGKVRITTDPDYRGEAYLEDSHGTAEIAEWSMSRVKVRLRVTAPDRLVLNQNYFLGWKAIRRWASGTVEKVPGPQDDASLQSPDGLVWIGVQPGVDEVEFYYLPDSFIRGAVVSGVTLFCCLALLLAGSTTNLRLVPGWQSWGLTRHMASIGRWCGSVGRSPAAAYLIAAVALNLPFLICHPRWTLVDVPLVRSLGVNAVLFLAPGLPLVGAMIGRGWLPRWHMLWVMAASLVVFAAVLVAVHLAGLPLEGSTIWNGTWIVTNLAIVLNIVLRAPPGWGIRPGDGRWRVGGPLIAVAYLAFFFGATRVVPPMQDHDLDIQSPAYSLLARFTPEVVNDRGLLHYFAHPLLLNCYEAASFLYFDQLDYLARFDLATERVKRAESGMLVEPVVRGFCCFSPTELGRDRGHRSAEAVGDEPGITRHRVLTVQGGNYLFTPPLAKWLRRTQLEHDLTQLPAREFEVQILYDDYRHEPRRLETRTPNMFLAAVTVALLGVWIDRRTGLWWLALLVGLAYATSPEVFVRSSYGGYFAISMFALMQILLAVERRSVGWPGSSASEPPESRGSGGSLRSTPATPSPATPSPATPSPATPSPNLELLREDSRAAWVGCLLAGLLAALANNKLILLPAALVLWELLRRQGDGVSKRLARAIAQPVVLGFALGTVAFWIYGLGISPGDFWADYAQIHVVDRITHYNPFGHSGYPTVPRLWQELWQHTGYVLLPLGIVAVAVLCWMKRGKAESGQTADVTLGWRGLPGLWAVWMLLIALAFSLIDWRQTKHLMPLLLPLHLAPARWAASGRTALILVSVLFAGLLAWNLGMLAALSGGFDSLPIRPSPAW